MRLSESVSDVLTSYQAGLDALIRSYIATLPVTGRLTEACAYALLNGGKRFRPALVQMMAKALGRPRQADQAALAIEFFHTASLIADDLPCMDDDDERRNRPSLHCAFDEATALLSSYALISAGYGCLAQNGRNLGASGAEITVLCLENVSLNTGIHGATGGQWLDLFPSDLNEKTLRRMIHQKTGALFEVAFVLGWLFGGGVPERLPVVKRAAGHFGMAFQLVDDLEDQAQDGTDTRCVNLATLLGSDIVEKSVDTELTLYRQALNELGIQNSELALLADFILQRGVVLPPSQHLT